MNILGTLGLFRIEPTRQEFRRERGDKGIRGDSEKGFSGNDATHRMADQDSSNGRVDGGRRGRGRDLNINDDILKPEWKENIALI